MECPHAAAVGRVRLRTISLPRLCGALSAPYYRVYGKSVHKGRQQKNSYLRPFVARKRWCSRRGNPCGCPGVGGHEGRPRSEERRVGKEGRSGWTRYGGR